MFDIAFSEGAVEDLKKMRAADRRAVVQAIEDRLGDRPGVPDRNRKILHNLVLPFEAVPPIWQLRAGDWRVFYDIDEEEHRVHVRAIRAKPPHMTTEEIQ